MLDVLVFAVCLVIGLVFTVFGFRKDLIAFLGIIFNVYVIFDVFFVGLTEGVGYVYGSINSTRSFDVGAIVLLPMFFVVVLVVGVVVRWRSR